LEKQNRLKIDSNNSFNMLHYIKTSFAFLLVSIVSIHSSKAQQRLNIIPQPNHVEIKNGASFYLSSEAVLVASGESKSVAQFFQNSLNQEKDLQPEISKKSTKQQIAFIENKSLNEEAYQIEVNAEKITITAAGKKGWFYGVQSLQQLLRSSLEIPSLFIDDEPRFGWRAYMLDESRYFHGEGFVKLLLDEMANLKMNVFHWHLTDDAGWRIEIKKYPLLTEVGSKRSDSEIGTWKSDKTAGVPHSGFYTQKQIKDIVAYAAERNITVVPEFEMPGHSSSAIAAYTWLGTAGKDIDVPIKFGRHYDNYDVTKPEVEQFVKDVLLEIFDLFPSEVIHIGGDEVGYKSWEDAEHVQKYMKENDIETPADLQIFFVNKISKFIEANGRRMMGWNEIMGKNIHTGFEEKKDDKEAETALAQNVVVHFWKGNLDLATEAAEKGYDIVNSLHSNTYLDYGYKNISVEKAYSFDPIPKGLDAKYHKNIFGLGCQMWSEWTPTNDDVAHQTFPRIAAYAEVGWTNLENKDYESFEVTLRKLQQQWAEKGINYAKVLDN
jgi:hexosaminidase